MLKHPLTGIAPVMVAGTAGAVFHRAGVFTPACFLNGADDVAVVFPCC